MDVVRLGPADRDLARTAFAVMSAVFETDQGELADAYLDRLLSDSRFWALAAIEDGTPVGCLTAHELPMTRAEETEVFVYDVAVRADRQRRGVGRALMRVVLDAAAQRGMDVFVPADDEDDHALAFYRALGGRGDPVTIFTFPGSA